MSKNNNPNFHAANFTTKVIEAYMNSLRGDASIEKIGFPQEAITRFCMEINDYVDEKTLDWFLKNRSIETDK